ncbi:type II secretion system protein GspL [Undibacterium fentianense]|uniref:GspL cytoplasmic actin-ATPase-like domain-containing protein n=1 Tax=Undibacterium fentianense TaxID=2828728 RepID=A0A941IAX0_9BURK|nr:type II secretion system protein GspL [Undibacterium fentianense]MBR7798409.1 hypothetical protein [Undibacterium fentianense]
MASTLYIQIPSKSALEDLGPWNQHQFSYCLASSDKRIIQQGQLDFKTAQEMISRVDLVTFLLSGSDVSFVDLQLPPMPFAKLKNAFPNLLEEFVLSDPSELLFVAHPPQDGRCRVAVVARDWMEQIYGLGSQLGATRIAAYAMSDTLIADDNQMTVAIDLSAANHRAFQVTARSSDNTTAGLDIDIGSLPFDAPESVEQLRNAIMILTQNRDCVIFLSPNLATTLSESALQLTESVQIRALDWQSKIAGYSIQSLNLLSPLGIGGKHSFDWLKWRWSITLVLAMSLISLSALNWKWLSMKRESDNVSDSIQAAYRNAFPKEPVSRDPLFQMQQKINAAKKLSGQSGNDDFLVLSAQFAFVWGQFVPAQNLATIATIEYRERSLFVTPKNLGDVPIDLVRNALKERKLKLDAQDGVLKISVDVGGM